MKKVSDEFMIRYKLITLHLLVINWYLSGDRKAVDIKSDVSILMHKYYYHIGTNSQSRPII